MNNQTAYTKIQHCNGDLLKIQGLIKQDPFNSANTFLLEYAVILACGTIEDAFKAIVIDTVTINASQELKAFLRKNFQKKGINPKYQNISQWITCFNSDWEKTFKNMIQQSSDKNIATNLISLVDARNTAAHGKGSKIAIDSTIQYYASGREMIHIVDSIVHP